MIHPKKCSLSLVSRGGCHVYFRWLVALGFMGFCMLTQSKMQSEHGPFSRYHTAKGDPEYAGTYWSLPPRESYFPPVSSERSNNSCHQCCTNDFRLTLLPNISIRLANRLSVSHFVSNEHSIQNVDFSSALFKEGHLPLLHTNCTVCGLQVQLSKLTVFSCLVLNADGCTGTILIFVKLKSACVTTVLANASMFSMPAVEPNNHAIVHALFFASVDGYCSASRISPGSVKSFDSCLFSSRETPSSALSSMSGLIPVTLILSLLVQAEIARISNIFQTRDAARVNLFTVQGSELSSPIMHCLLPHQVVDELHPLKRTSVLDHIKLAFPRLSITNSRHVGCWTAAVCVAIFCMAFVSMTWNLGGLFCHSGITGLNRKRFREKGINAFAVSVLCLATAPLCAMGNLGVCKTQACD